MRCFALLAALCLSPLLAHAQAAAPTATPTLEALTPDEFAALRPFADHGGAFLVRDPSGGARARVTVLVPAHAPRQTVYDVISRVEDYPQFFRSLDRLEVTSRHGAHIAVRLHTALSIFSVETVATLHLVNDHRIDGQLIESQLGPGALRWDLYPGDGDVTYVAYTTWDDPTTGNWFLRQVANASPDAIAGMEMSYDMMQALMTAHRAEDLAHTHGIAAPSRPQAPSGPIVAPAPGPWFDIIGDRIVGGVQLNAQGETVQTFVAGQVAAPLGQVCGRVEDVSHYGNWWRSIRAVVPGARQGLSQRFHARVDSALFHAEGDQDRIIEPGQDHAAVRWVGVSGDFSNDEQRWDFFSRSSGGTVVVFSGAGDYVRTGMVVRAMIDSVPWMLPGYSTALKMLWLRELSHGL